LELLIVKLRISGCGRVVRDHCTSLPEEERDKGGGDAGGEELDVGGLGETDDVEEVTGGK